MNQDKYKKISDARIQERWRKYEDGNLPVDGKKSKIQDLMERLVEKLTKKDEV